jgi:hypothetical protein
MPPQHRKGQLFWGSYIYKVLKQVIMLFPFILDFEEIFQITRQKLGVYCPVEILLIN